MHYAVSVPNLGYYADARILAGLAHDAEEAGWDGFFIWDHIALPWPVKVVDPWIALTAIALNTRNIRFGPMVTPLSNNHEAHHIVKYRGERERSSKMSQTDPSPTDPHQGNLLAAPQEQYQQTMKAFGKFVERITPWLFDVGTWIFGGLLAFTLLVMASLFTIGPVDPAILVATTAFALALPLDVTGLFLLRLIPDLKQVGFEEELAQAFQEAGFPAGAQIPASTALEAVRTRRAETVLGYCLGILALSVLLTLTGLVATLWHMAWWIALGFCAMVMLGLVLVILAIATSQPPDSAEEKEQKRRDRQELTRQAKDQDQKNGESA